MKFFSGVCMFFLSSFCFKISSSHRQCYNSNQTCFDYTQEQTFTADDVINQFDNLCPVNHHLLQIINKNMSDLLMRFINDSGISKDAGVPIGLKITNQAWKDVIPDDEAKYLQNGNFLTMKITKTNSVWALDLHDHMSSETFPFGCIANDNCQNSSSTSPSNLLIKDGNDCTAWFTEPKTFYEAQNYCHLNYCGSLVSFEYFQKHMWNLFKYPSVKEFWLSNSRTSLVWKNSNANANYTNWGTNLPSPDTVFAYVKAGDPKGLWQPFDDDDDDDDDYDSDDIDNMKFAVICTSGSVIKQNCSNPDKKSSANPSNGQTKALPPQENRTPTYKPIEDQTNSIQKALDHLPDYNAMKIGLGIGIGLGLVLLVLMITTLVVCFRRKHSLDSFLKKLPSVRTLNSIHGNGITGGDSADVEGHNNYVQSDYAAPASNPCSNGGYENPYDNNTNPNTATASGQYEIPDGTPVIEHIYNSVNYPRFDNQERQQQQLNQLSSHRSYIEIIP